MIAYVKLKHDNLGVIWSSFWGIYTQAEGIDHLNIWRNRYYKATDLMKARKIIVSFCIFSLLKYDKIFGKNMEQETYGVK